MGVTVHFEGHVDGSAAREAVISAAVHFANNNGWPCHSIAQGEAILKRVINEQNVDYAGPTTGVELQPHGDCEPFRLEFDRDNFCQEYCKTQFAPIDIHVKITELLHILQPMFIDLFVDDEGEYFEFGNRDQLQQHIDACFRIMEKIKAERPDHSGPYRLSSGRIVDLRSDA